MRGTTPVSDTTWKIAESNPRRLLLPSCNGLNRISHRRYDLKILVLHDGPPFHEVAVQSLLAGQANAKGLFVLPAPKHAADNQRFIGYMQTEQHDAVVVVLVGGAILADYLDIP